MVLVAGCLSLIIGFAGFLLPFLQGWFFTIVGIILLSLYFPNLRTWLEHKTQRWPHVHELVGKIQAWADRNIGEI